MKMENEVRLVDANALIEDITAAEENAGMGAVVAGTLRRYVNRRPTIDPESLRPKGRWGVHRESEISKTVYCTNCWKEFYINRKGEVQIDTQPYCPNCGAKMEG